MLEVGADEQGHADHGGQPECAEGTPLCGVVMMTKFPTLATPSCVYRVRDVETKSRRCVSPRYVGASPGSRNRRLDRPVICRTMGVGKGLECEFGCSATSM